MSQLSIVVISYNRAADLARTLKNLAGLAVKADIIVVDNASTDRTPVMVKELFPQVKLIELKENLKAVARNIGLEAARTPYVAFSDDDSWWAPGALEKAVEVLEAYPQVGAVVAKTLVNEEHKPDPINQYYETSPVERLVDMPGVPVLGFLGCAVVFRKEAYQAAGGYNSHISFMGEEELLATDLASLGWGMTYLADIVAYHYPSTTRNVAERQKLGIRNRIWTAWMRRPLKSALSVTASQFKRGLKNKNRMIGCLDAVRQLPNMLQYRKVVAPLIERQFQLLELQRKEIENMQKNIITSQIALTK